MIVALLSFGLFSAVFSTIVNTFGFVVLTVCRLYARLFERLIERPRGGGWVRRGIDQALLDLATANAIRQVSWYGAYPGPAGAAVRLVRVLRLG